MFEYIISFALGGLVFFLVGMNVGEVNTEKNIEHVRMESIESGYTKAHTEQLGKDIGVPVAKCKLSGGEPIVIGNRVACVKEMRGE